MRSRGWTGAASVALVATSLLVGVASPAVAAKPSAESRYSLVHGCFALRSEATGGLVAKGGDGYAATASGTSGAEPFRMQATDLGRYLFYGTERDFLSLAGNGVEPAEEPSDDSDWTVEEDGDAFTIRNDFADRRLAVDGAGAVVAVPGSAGEAGRFSFVEATGCPEYPEVGLNVKGKPTRAEINYGEVTGTLEGHMHGMAFEFLGGRVHCGRPWHRFGAPYALVDCPDHTATDGCGAVLDNVLYGDPARCHDPGGWPTFTGWPHYKSLTHEQSYWRWLERAWAAGMRLYVNLMVENRVLCEHYPLKQNSCNEMDSVLLQIKRIHEMQDYIDAQAGGPGKGFFRIVRNPFQARRVISRGKLAVVQGMEVSEPFGCRLQFGAPTCTEEDIDAWLDRLERLGLRQFEITNKLDNALTGVAGDDGTTGAAVNYGNFYATGRFWDLEHCDDAENSDKEPAGVHVHNDDAIIANGFNAFLPPGAAPVYPEPPHCNTLGLSPLGEHAVRGLMKREMIFDPDHMSVKGRNQALTLLESRDYSGIVSSHSWSTPNAYPRIYRLGGVITPSSDLSVEYFRGGTPFGGLAETWTRLRKAHTGRQYFGIGYGADQNGFAKQPGPRDPGLGPPVRYPFRSFDGSTRIFPQRSGERVYDINTDGIAHYGLYPDWIEDLRTTVGTGIVRDLGRGAEAYLQMWERAEGIEEVRCDQWRQRFLTPRGLARRVELGDRPKQVLKRAGQPVSRTRAWRWCAKTRGKGDGGKHAAKQQVFAVFSKRGRVALVESTLRKHRAAGIRPEMPASELRGHARALGGGLWVRDAGNRSRYVYGVRGGRVTFVGVATASVASSAPSLRKYLRLARPR